MNIYPRILSGISYIINILKVDGQKIIYGNYSPEKDCVEVHWRIIRQYHYLYIAIIIYVSVYAHEQVHRLQWYVICRKDMEKWRNYSNPERWPCIIDFIVFCLVACLCPGIMSFAVIIFFKN